MENQEGLIVGGDPEKDFFEQNPEFRYFDWAQELCDTEEKTRSSVIMWAIYLAEDPYSTFYDAKIDPEERREMINRTYATPRGVTLNWEERKGLIRKYVMDSMPRQKKRFKIINDQFDRFLMDLSDTEDARVLTGAFSKIEAMYKGLSVAEKAFDREKQDYKKASGKQQSGKYGKKRG